jgi:hypothetical protein
VLHRIRTQVSFANVMAMIAVSVAVGGTSYAAVTLPRDSVGRQQIKRSAVGKAEIGSGAVTSRALKNGAVQPQDLSSTTKATLAGKPGPQGPPGPAGVTLRAALNSGGGTVAGNATFVTSGGVNKWLIGFSRNLSGCVPTATLARNTGGQTVDPGPGRIVVGMERDLVAVETYNASGAPERLPFNVIVAC